MTRTEASAERERDYRIDQVTEHYWPTETRWTWANDYGHHRATLRTVRGFPLELWLPYGPRSEVESVEEARTIVSERALGLAVVAPNGTVLHQGERLGWERQARYLGADAAAAAASWLILSAADAESILSDVDPMVLDGLGEPNLSGEWADDLTPDLLTLEVTGLALTDDRGQVSEAISDAWEGGRDAIWSSAIEGVALRTLGDIPGALVVEQRVERRIDALRKAAGL